MRRRVYVFTGEGAKLRIVNTPKQLLNLEAQGIVFDEDHPLVKYHLRANTPPNPMKTWEVLPNFVTTEERSKYALLKWDSGIKWDSRKYLLYIAAPVIIAIVAVIANWGKLF